MLSLICSCFYSQPHPNTIYQYGGECIHTVAGLTALFLLFLLASGNVVAWLERVILGGGTHAPEYYLSNSTPSQPLLGCVLGMNLWSCLYAQTRPPEVLSGLVLQIWK